MILRWERGRDIIDGFIQQKAITQVPANRELADEYIRQAEAHLASASTIKASDAVGAFQLTYDAARKALAAILVNQGLRVRGEGGHSVLYEAVYAQLVPPMGDVLSDFSWMRPLRNKSEYPNAGEVPPSLSDVEEAEPAAQSIIDVAKRVLDNMPAYGK